ncbi:MAG: DUF1800 family protein [Bacteroidota bacterium]
MEKILFLFCWCLAYCQLNAQIQHLDFIGAGHQQGIKVTTSSSSTESTGQKTIDGFPIQNEAQLKDASRFLAQCTFGADFPTIQMTAAMGYEAWLEEQFQLPRVSIMEEMINHSYLYGETGGIIDDPIYHAFFRSAWITNNLTTPDLLRQRMAFNWSQIMVINDGTDFFEDVGQIMGTYYDTLSANVFTNYEKLLTDVTLSPAMGFFLSHYNNPKANLELNIHPDENYAREIMQLFSIGLWELNPDGTRKRDAQGEFIPTYSNADIKEFAQVFTGLGAGTENGAFGNQANELEENVVYIVIRPMKMYEDFHDISEKHLLNGVVLPANQSGMQDIQQSISHLSNHANTAPFIVKSLIKMLTTSNPSPRYVRAVAATFDPDAPNNFQEVIKAILLHPEARNCNISEHYTFGKLREPMVRLMNLLRTFPLNPNDNKDFPYVMYCFGANTGQSPLEAPSVFNFFLPDYQPQGPIGQNYLVAPEFQILNSTNAIGVINDVHRRAVRQTYLGDVCVGDGDDAEEEEEEFRGNSYMDYSSVLELVNQPTQLVNRLDILLANGLLSNETKQIIINAIQQLNDPNDRLKMVLYLILISPDYAILK